MKLRIYSDLHLEFMPRTWKRFVDELPDHDGPVVLAGDITSCHAGAPLLHDVLTYFCQRFDKILFVPGNHEFYGGSYEDVKKLVALARDANPDKLEVLDFGWNRCVNVGGVEFVGSTLWYGEPDDPSLKLYMNDYVAIEDFERWVYANNKEDRAFLNGAVCLGDVVITHHLPTMRSVSPRFKSSALNPFFVSPLDELIVEEKPQLWIHGHTHDTLDYMHGETRIVCNPYGYAGHELNPNFDPAFTVEVFPQEEKTS